MKKKTINAWIQIILGSIFGCIVTMLATAFFFGGDIRALFVHWPYLVHSGLQNIAPVDQQSITQLTHKNIIFSSSDLLGQIGEIYSTLIVILIALITGITVLTLFFVKNSAEEKAEKQARRAARQIINDRIEPKINALDKALFRIDEQHLPELISRGIKTHVLDSKLFWKEIDESLYKQQDDALEDYLQQQTFPDVDMFKTQIDALVEEINKIKRHILVSEESSEDESETIVLTDEN